jgi:hypothetical protein
MQEDWRSEEQKEIDLQIENQGLEEQITLKGGLMGTEEDIDPELHNQFLKNIIAFEEADELPQMPMRSLFPSDYEFPPGSSMSDEAVSRKLEEIEELLDRHNVAFGFANKLPDRVLYRYLVEECIPHETVTQATQAGFTWTLDGCDGCCEECFQKDYCPTAEEILNDNEDPDIPPADDSGGDDHEPIIPF